jgi:hypothetical protein
LIGSLRNTPQSKAVHSLFSSTTTNCVGASIPKWDGIVSAPPCAAEQRGFPKKHPLWGGRYMPAVQEWLDADNGLRKNGFLSSPEDGPEDFNAPSR